jgi:hypothetical protein
VTLTLLVGYKEAIIISGRRVEVVLKILLLLLLVLDAKLLDDVVDAKLLELELV